MRALKRDAFPEYLEVQVSNQMHNQITKADVDYALGFSPWDLGNEVLYKLCKDYPRHDRGDAIIAKVWLISRSYAAAVERRLNANGQTSDDFYENTVVEGIRKSKLDDMLADLPDRMTDPWNELGKIVSLHRRLVDCFFEITELKKRSLASKYLHFHRPDLFFIYDSRANKAIRQVTPFLKQLPNIEAEVQDRQYHDFCRRAQWLKEDIEKQFCRKLTPRQIDKILLRIHGKAV